MVRMQARKRFPYKGRRIKKGEFFFAKDKDARVLRALKRAANAPEGSEVAAAPPVASENAEAASAAPAAADGEAAGSSESPDLAALRDEYFQLAGKRAYHAWDAATVRAKIEALKAPSAE